MLTATIIGGVASLICMLVVVTYWHLHCRKRNTTVSKLKWLDIVDLFNDTQMMPVEHERDWTLVDIVHNLRVYCRTVSLNSHFVTLFACTTKIKASSTLALSVLRDFHRQLDWNVSAERPTSATGSGSSNSGDQSQTSNLPATSTVNRDVIRQRRHYTATDGSSWWSPARWRRRRCSQPRIIHRYWYREDNSCCWLLEHDEDASVWSLYLMQPCTEGWFASKCVLTIISCGVHYSLLASRLACLRDLMALKLAQRTPVVRLTASAASDQQQKQQKQQQKQASTTVTQSDSAAATTATSESADKDKDVSLLQRFKRIIDEKRESYEQERRKKAQQGSADVSGGTMAEVILGLLTPGNPGAAATVDATPATTTAATVSRSKPSATPEDDTGEAPTATATATTTSAADLRRRKVTSNTASTSDNNSTLRRSQSAESTSATCDDRQEKTTAQESTPKSRSKQPLDTIAKQQMKDMITAADTTATCLIMEKTNVSHLNVQSSLMEQAKQTGGWTYTGLKKDVVILRKMHINEKVSLHSYMGKGIIPCDPKLVFDIIRDPLKRTYYDEQVTIDVIHQFSTAMKIVYMQYEVSQLFKKDGLDFCVLQSDKQMDGVKFVVTMQSVHWPDCPAPDSITRVKLVQSGWIIEPVMQNESLHSMVTYISQMELDRAKSNAAGALDELSSRQPMCIFNLRHYVTSSQTNDVAVAPAPVQ